MEFDANNSPFIPLPTPNKNIIITPPRYSDGDAVIKLLNDPRVFMNLAGPPFPYSQQEWDEWFPAMEKGTIDAFAEWKAVEKARKESYGISQGSKYWVGGGLPVNSIRDVDPVTGEQKFVGTIGVNRGEFAFFESEEEQKRIREKYDAMEAGNPEISWETGFYLAPSHHGRGIMTAALGALVNAFMIPYMNLHLLTGNYFEHNVASRKVFEKNGFVLWKCVPVLFELPESKTGVKGKKTGIGFMRWIRTP